MAHLAVQSATACPLPRYLHLRSDRRISRTRDYLKAIPLYDGVAPGSEKWQQQAAN